jgi:hypothetical protein
MQHNALLAWQNFIMQKVGITHHYAHATTKHSSDGH